MKLPILKGLHLTAHGLLRVMGYHWELRRSGDQKLGLWRKELKSRPKGEAFPRRLVFVPGFGDTPLSWLGVLSALQPILSRRFDEIVIFDFPGFSGFLSQEKSFPSMDLMIAAVHDAFDSLRPQTIIGHSLGAWLTAHYAGTCGAGDRPLEGKSNYRGPERVILMNVSGFFENEAERKTWEDKFRRVMDDGFQELRPYLFAKEPFWFRWVASEFAKFASKEDIVQFMKSVREDHYLETLVPRIRAHVWLVWGEDDTLNPPGCAPRWLENLKESPGASVVLLKGTGHSPQVERPAVITAVLGQILRKDAVTGALGERWWRLLPASAPRVG